MNFVKKDIELVSLYLKYQLKPSGLGSFINQGLKINKDPHPR